MLSIKGTDGVGSGVDIFSKPTPIVQIPTPEVLDRRFLTKLHLNHQAIRSLVPVRHKTEQSRYRMSVAGDGQRDYMALEPGE